MDPKAGAGEWAHQRREEPAPTTPGRDTRLLLWRSVARNALYGIRDREGTERTPSPKRLVWLLLGDPENMEATERGALDGMLKASADVAVIYPLIQQFQKMIKKAKSDGQAERFDCWLKAALTSGVKDFETFALGLKREHSAVEAALTLPYSNGQTEGQNKQVEADQKTDVWQSEFPDATSACPGSCLRPG